MRLTTLLASVALCGSLSACGGGSFSFSAGGVSGGIGSGSSGGGGTGQGGAHASLIVFESLPPANANPKAYLQQLNAQGAKGLRYVGDQAFGDGAQSVFVQDGLAPSYTYELQPGAATVGDFLAQANAEGARGFRYLGLFSVGGSAMALYRADAGTAADYSYIALPPAASPAAFVAEANSQGSSGYWYAGPLPLNGAQDVFMRNSASPSTYAYQYQTAATTADGLAAQLNHQGSLGYRYKGALVFGGTSANLYIRDPSQNAAFAYATAPVPASGAAFVSQANGMGMAYIGPISLGAAAGGTFELYFSSGSCSGFLCVTLDGPTQN